MQVKEAQRKKKSAGTKKIPTQLMERSERESEINAEQRREHAAEGADVVEVTVQGHGGVEQQR